MNILAIEKTILFTCLLVNTLTIEITSAYDCNLPSDCLLETKNMTLINSVMRKWFVFLIVKK